MLHLAWLPKLLFYSPVWQQRVLRFDGDSVRLKCPIKPWVDRLYFALIGSVYENPGGLCGHSSEADVCNSKLLSWSLVVVYGGRKLTHEKPIKLNDVENRTQKKLEMEIASCRLGKKVIWSVHQASNRRSMRILNTNRSVCCNFLPRKQFAVKWMVGYDSRAIRNYMLNIIGFHILFHLIPNWVRSKM